jgi:hypothetical protein
MTLSKFRLADGTWQVSSDVVAWIGIVLLALAGMMLFEAVIALLNRPEPPRSKPHELALGAISE